jgi:hypothetical protein
MGEDEMSFVIHLWLEDREHPAWRGRITDGDGAHSSAFEDEESLLGHIRGRLRAVSNVALPTRRSVA